MKQVWQQNATEDFNATIKNQNKTE